MAKRPSAVKTQKEIVEQSPVPPLDTDAFRGEVERLAHQYWIERGCPIGTPDEDWFRAERDINGKRDVPDADKAMNITAL